MSDPDRHEILTLAIGRNMDPAARALVGNVMEGLAEYTIGGEPANLRYALRALRALAILDATGEDDATGTR